MMEMLADHDDVLMEQLLEDVAPENEIIFDDLVQEMQRGEICLCSLAVRSKATAFAVC